MGALRWVPLGPVAVSGEAARVVSLQVEKDSRSHRRIGEVREQAVDAEPVELQVFVHRAAGTVRYEATLFVTKPPGVHKQPELVRAIDEVVSPDKLSCRLAASEQI